VIDSDFQKTLSSYQLNDLGDERGVKVWTGELATATTLNQDVITAFPVDQALGDLQPGVYVMTATAKGPGSDDDGRLATQWFIVSDMGLTAFSGDDGVHAFVRSLASTDPIGSANVKLIARNNEVLATLKTDANGYARFDGAIARGEGGLQGVGSRTGVHEERLGGRGDGGDADRQVLGRDEVVAELVGEVLGALKHLVAGTAQTRVLHARARGARRSPGPGATAPARRPGAAASADRARWRAPRTACPGAPCRAAA
jgi:hypothetical protein